VHFQRKPQPRRILSPFGDMFNIAGRLAPRESRMMTGIIPLWR
jgi:hypothetical protein